MQGASPEQPRGGECWSTEGRGVQGASPERPREASAGALEEEEVCRVHHQRSLVRRVPEHQRRRCVGCITRGASWRRVPERQDVSSDRAQERQGECRSTVPEHQGVSSDTS